MNNRLLSKKYKINKSIDQLWNEFKNDNEFKNIKVDAIEKMATDTYFFAFTFYKNRYLGIPISLLCGTAVSSEDGWSNVEIKPKQRTGVSSLLIFGVIFFLLYAGTSLFPFINTNIGNLIRAMIVGLLVGLALQLDKNISAKENDLNINEFAKQFGLLDESC